MNRREFVQAALIGGSAVSALRGGLDPGADDGGASAATAAQLFPTELPELQWQEFRASGFDVPFFTADGGGNMMAGGHLDDVLPGLNGGGKNSMKEGGKYRPKRPWVVPEFFPGWFR